MQIVHQENHEKDWHKQKESQPHKSSNLKHQTQNNYIHHPVHQQSHTSSYSPVSLFHDLPSNIIWDHLPPLVAFLHQALKYHKWKNKSCRENWATPNQDRNVSQKQKQKGIFEMIQSRGHIDKVPQISIVHLPAIRWSAIKMLSRAFAHINMPDWKRSWDSTPVSSPLPIATFTSLQFKVKESFHVPKVSIPCSISTIDLHFLNKKKTNPETKKM